MSQPDRQPSDGGVEVRRLSDGKWVISAETDGERQAIVCGEFNVWRIFGMMAVMLGVNLPKKISASIKL